MQQTSDFLAVAPSGRTAIVRGMAALVLGLVCIACSQAATAPAPARALAPGVITTIARSFSPDETVSTHDVVEIRANPAPKWKPEYLSDANTLFGMSEGVKFRRAITCLEFSFKPLRMIEVDVPTASGMQKKLVWYLVYSVRNTGEALNPVAGKDGVYATQMVKAGPVRFLPHFVLESQDRLATGQRVSKAYLDRVIPSAVAAIEQREKTPQRLLNSVQMGEQPIPVSEGRINRSVWGVATWTDVDPRIDFFSVYVGGLTNAYVWRDMPGAYQAGDAPGTGRRFAKKTLQLNFWRPGDELSPNETEFRYGVPLNHADLYGVPDGVAYRWLYR